MFDIRIRISFDGRDTGSRVVRLNVAISRSGQRERANILYVFPRSHGCCYRKEDDRSDPANLLRARPCEMKRPMCLVGVLHPQGRK